MEISTTPVTGFKVDRVLLAASFNTTALCVSEKAVVTRTRSSSAWITWVWTGAPNERSPGGRRWMLLQHWSRHYWEHRSIGCYWMFSWKKRTSWWFPFEKYSSKWESSPNWGENKNCLKPPPRDLLQFVLVFVRAGLEVLMSRWVLIWVQQKISQKQKTEWLCQVRRFSGELPGFISSIQLFYFS